MIVIRLSSLAAGLAVHVTCEPHTTAGTAAGKPHVLHAHDAGIPGDSDVAEVGEAVKSALEYIDGYAHDFVDHLNNCCYSADDRPTNPVRNRRRGR